VIEFSPIIAQIILILQRSIYVPVALPFLQGEKGGCQADESV
jgi:hypothetical protein